MLDRVKPHVKWYQRCILVTGDEDALLQFLVLDRRNAKIATELLVYITPLEGFSINKFLYSRG
jgi:hypothetical protein